MMGATGRWPRSIWSDCTTLHLCTKRKLTAARICVEMDSQSVGSRFREKATPSASEGQGMDQSETTTERTSVTLLRQIPAVDELLSRAALRALEARVGRRLLVDATRKVFQSLRGRILNGSLENISAEMLEAEIVAATQASSDFSLRTVINATGVILHTNLGRAPLAREAVDHLVAAATQYSNLEYDLERGERGQRDAHTDRLFAQLLGAERALVVNNNAAAVFLALNTLAEGGEVVVSRGELVEIGGSFRIPDICAKSGAVLREVGTTNRTRIADYAAAINERTRVLMRVHPSNFRIVGFTERPALEELVELGHGYHLAVLEDLGSGCLVDLAPLGIEDEPPVGLSLKSDADVVTFSGDKLLGGPQAGIMVGKREPLERIRKNPLFRALRVDKLTISVLEATIGLYLRGRSKAIPALRMIQTSPADLVPRARRLADRISGRMGISASVEDGNSIIGGGSTPGHSLPTKLVSVNHARHSAQELEALLRRNLPPIIARLERGRLLLDLRTVFEDQDEEVAQALENIT
jgi:L-seryl-tRNA(Ser) seleniumtransferase